MSPCARDQRFLNRSGKALTFRIRRFRKCSPQERQPGSRKRASSNLMGGAISFHAPRNRPIVLVEMNADKNAIAYAVGKGRAVGQRDICIAKARHLRRDPFCLQQSIDSPRYVEGQVFFKYAATHRTGVLSAMARIENNYCEWPRCRGGLCCCRSLSGFRSRRPLHPDKGSDHQEDAEER